MRTDRIAVYTAVYPGVEKYLASWYSSVLAQTDTDFDLWISVDSLDIDEVAAALGGRSSARFISAQNTTPAEIRHQAIARLVEAYSAVVFVDSDDLLYPTRVERARKDLQLRGLVGYALRIIDERETDLGISFGPASADDLETLLPRYNVFGLSNTAYRADVLRECLPIPGDCICVDWLLATRAWAIGADLHFDQTPQMAYRQYSANTARVLLPFTSYQVLRATRYVLNHYRCVVNNERPLPSHCKTPIVAAQRSAQAFYGAISNAPSKLERYVDALNQLTPRYVWWWCVAHPALEDIWKN